MLAGKTDGQQPFDNVNCFYCCIPWGTLSERSTIVISVVNTLRSLCVYGLTLFDLIADSGSDSNVVAIRSYNDFIRVLSETKLTDSLVTELTKGLVGWPKFKEVFTGN